LRLDNLADFTDVETDSRKITPGALFVAIKGETTDGHLHIDDAVARGARAVVVERDLSASVPTIRVPSTADALPEIARRFFRDPSKDLAIVGITGTNGKTTTTFLLRSVLETAGKPTAVIGTVGYFFRSEQLDAPNTTPDALLLNRMLARARDEGMTHVVMEVSSHALKLGRVDGIRFASAVFTNLTQDHLDFHSDMEDYFSSKRMLFERVDRGAINPDDPYGARLLKEFPKMMPFGSAKNVVMTIHGTEFELRGRRIKTRLVGKPNVENCLAAAAAAETIGISFDAIARGLETAKPPRGRFELVESDRDFAIAVDYAHTPDALERLLATGRELRPRRLLVVFGCGGDRDRKKRPIMGEIASRLADEVWVTSDNPRTEDPERILDDVTAGIKGPHRRIADRREAIFDAVRALGSGDLLLIAGKGHEDYQILGRTKIHFDDVEVAREALK